jgi:hypothetical protein
MLLSDEEIEERLTSPNNLLNRLREATTPKLPLPGANNMPPTSKDLDIDIDAKLAATLIRDKAAVIMASALDELKHRMPDVQKPEKLAAIAAEMNKVLTSRQDQDKVKPSQIIVYAPAVISENHFETILAQNEE